MKGFSLIEVLITVVIFSLIFAAMFSIMNQGLKSWHVADINIEVQQDVRRALMAMDRQLRQSRASQISIPTDDNYYTSITFKIPQDVNGDGKIADTQGNIEWSANITYSVDGNEQVIRTDADGASVLAKNITSLQFKRFSGNPNVIDIQITGQKATIADKNSQVNIGALVKVRN